MKIKALVSFAGKISMVKDEIKDAADEVLAASLGRVDTTQNARLASIFSVFLR